MGNENKFAYAWFVYENGYCILHSVPIFDNPWEATYAMTASFERYRVENTNYNSKKKYEFSVKPVE